MARAWRFRIAHELLVPHPLHGDGRLAQESRDRRDIAFEQRIVGVGHAVVPVEERIDVGGPDRDRVPREDDVARVGIEPGEEVEGERVGGRLVEQQRMADSSPPASSPR